MRFLSTAFFVGALAVPALAQESSGGASSRHYATESWKTDRGLPQNSVNAIAQDQRGMLWLGTFGGLVQFDGVGMRTFAAADGRGLPTNRILSLCVDRRGTLWVGTENRGLFRHDSGHFVAVPADDSALTIGTIEEGRDGRLWVVTTRGLTEVVGGRLVMRYESPEDLIFDLACAADGSVYLAGRSGLRRFAQGRIEHWPASRLTSIAIDGRGTVWCGGVDGLVRLTKDGLARCLTDSTGKPPHHHDLHWSPNLGLLAMDSDGCHEVVESPSGVELRLLCRQAFGRCVRTDRDGRLWIGSDGDGLVLCRATDLRAIAQGRITLVVAHPDGGHCHAAANRVTRVTAAGKHILLHEFAEEVFAMALAPDGGLWVAQGADLWRLGADGEASRTWHGTEARGQDIVALSVVANGDVLAGRLDGSLTRFRGGAMDRLAAPGVGTVHCMVAGARSLWVGGAIGAARSEDDGATWTVFASGRELAVGEVRGIVEDTTGACWIGTYGGGLSCVRGASVRRVGRVEGLPCDAICQLEISDGYLFLNTNEGLFSSALADLCLLVDGAAPAAAWGMFVSPHQVRVEGNGYKWPSSCRLQDGSWLFCNIDALVHLQAGAIASPGPSLSAVVLESNYDAASAGGGNDSRHLHVRYTAPTYQGAEFVVFRHRLDAEKAHWTLAGHKREATIFGLSPGSHRFEVQARSFSGNWGESAVLTFEVPFAWYERPLAWLGGLVLMALGVVLVARLASRGQKRRNEALAEAVAARTTELEREVERRRAAEIELQAAQRELEARVVGRTAELQAAVAQIEADAKAREVLQRQVDQLQRMESVGKLAGGIAHDFNNLLTVVLGSCELLQTRSFGEQQRKDLLLAIADAGRRGRGLTQQLLTFARSQVVDSVTLDLAELLRGATQLLRRLLPDNIRLDLQAGTKPVLIQADKAQIEQVLVNLSVNARDAMPEGGSLRILLHTSGDAPPFTCTLRVVDDGTGMTSDVRDRACEPFFSTKHRATNSGLGLSTCYGIVKGLGGTLAIESAAGEGTTIVITLPCTESVGSNVASTVAPAVELPRPRRLQGKALLIEDDDAVRQALVRMLTALGCDVVAVENGDRALVLLDGGQAIDFVLSDLIMPGLQGPELVDAIRARRPGLPIVFLSGYHDAAGAAKLRAQGIEVLRKPPDGQQVVASIEAARSQRGVREGHPFGGGGRSNEAPGPTRKS